MPEKTGPGAAGLAVPAAGHHPCCGIDEAGRGALAGPVVAAAVILPAGRCYPGLTDSKKLAPARREQLCAELLATATTATGSASPAEIDATDILQATLLAMIRAVRKLRTRPALALVDGPCLPRSLPCPARGIIRGDSLVPAISAASVVAKVTRDRIMRDCERDWPGYGFGRHKGYGTSFHLERLAVLGACPLHRNSFAPVRACIRDRQPS